VSVPFFSSIIVLDEELLPANYFAVFQTTPALGSAKNPYSAPERLHGIPKEIILYQYEVCPFCCKVKAFLDYHKVRRTSHLNY
jgi:hypothetical protein